MLHKGIGLKRLKGDFWEIRHGLKARILFRWEGNLVEFIHSRPENRTLQGADGIWPLSISPKKPRALARVCFILAGDHNGIKRFLKNI